MRFEGIVSSIDWTATKVGRVQYKIHTHTPDYVYMTFEQPANWALIGDKVTVEVTNDSDEARCRHDE